MRESKVRVGVHWLRFSGGSELLSEVVFFLESLFGAVRWEENKGRWGYRYRKTAGAGFDILFGGSEEMGFCVDIAGGWLDVLSDDRIAQLLNFASRFRVTRLDLAVDVDDGGELVGKILKKVRSDEYVSLASQIAVYETLKGKEKGRTVAIGSRSSDRYFRIYDKRGFSRIEVELKGIFAQEAIARIAEGEHLGGVFRSLISFRFIDKNVKDSNKSRWRVSVWWESFLNSLGKAVRMVVYRARDVLRISMAYCESAIRCVVFLKLVGLYSNISDRALSSFSRSVWGVRHLTWRNLVLQET